MSYPVEHPNDQVVSTIAFGSCNDQNRPQPMWKQILQQNPDLFVWLGDNVYPDSENLDDIMVAYRKQLSNPDYKTFKSQVPIIGIWDDHDYGVNDGGKHFRNKGESKDFLLQFLGVDEEDSRHFRAGAYTSYTYGTPGKTVRIILIDTRYFRDNLKRNKEGYIPTVGDMLGLSQWSWLENQFKHSEADVHIIASSIQVLPIEHPYEKWDNLTESRRKLFELIQKYQPKNTFIISGDRHHAEFMELKLNGMEQPLFEATSSSLNKPLNRDSTWVEEANKYRIRSAIYQENYGLIRILWQGENPSVMVDIKGVDNQHFMSHKVF
ncbi:MAG: alkaline phosphatase family protein [Cytophagales bacterium]|nr:alkaline phosphatase family protein [Cytophagales bacterium]